MGTPYPWPFFISCYYLLLCQGQHKPEGRTFTGSTLYTISSIVLFDNCPADMQSQSQAYTRPALHFDPWHPVKALPDVLLIGSRYSWSLVTQKDTRYLLFHHQTNLHRQII